ncbi:hypothetical protein F4778DRAFT_801665 [Xylariomycetidae sp. FL2044]|nr:hypothetical protein F4778DRAFT_801665 [Xylariomycetidae sp. FL2044]
MESFLPRAGFQLPFQRRLSRLYNDTKKSSDFVKEPVQGADDPEIKALHRKLRIQKDRLVSWGLEWSDPNQAAEIDEALQKAGLTDLVGSIMATIKDILAEAEPLWLASRRPTGSEKTPEKSAGDVKAPLIVWDRGRFEDLVKDLTASIDTLCELSRTRSSTLASSGRLSKSTASMEDLRPYGSTRIQTPQQIDPHTLTSLKSMQALPISETEAAQDRLHEIHFMSKQAFSELTRRPGRQAWSPLLVEYAYFDPIYSVTGIMPDMSRFERLSSGLQTESQRPPGAWSGLPLLLGYYEDMERSRLALVYQFPPSFNPVTFENLTQNPLDNLCTLTELLDRPDFEPTLEAKFRLAHNLANTVFDMHIRGITHGNLHSSTISFCHPVGNDPGMPVGEVDIRRPLLSSFDIFPNDAPSDPNASAFLLHRHPLDPRTTNQSPLASNQDAKTLDLYSLAMMLVTIGLWTKLENIVPDQGTPSVPESVLRQLAIRCGTPYMRAVQACWDAVEQELAAPEKSDEILSQVQVRAGRYLEACCILDGISTLEERFSDDYTKVSTTVDTKLDITVASSSGQTASPVSKRDSDTKRASNTTMSSPVSTRTRPLSQSVGATPTRPKDKLRLYPQAPLSSEIIEQWNRTLMPQINIALRQFYRKNPESVEISLESIGESPQKTTPTVLVVCTSVSKVRAILNKKLGVLFDGTTGFGLKVCRGSVLRSRKGPARSMAKEQASETTSSYGDQSEDDADEEPAANPGYQERPLNGASIGAWIGDKHLPPVSFGGLIMVDDRTYGMTVHHMLDDPERIQKSAGHHDFEAEGPQRANAPPVRSSAAAQDISPLLEGDSSADSSDDFACEFSDSDSEFSATDITSDDEEDYEEEEFTEDGDIPGVEPGCGEGYIVTQPALDDVPEGFYPTEEEKDDDHLDTYGLGEVYATSGIRRRAENGLVHEIDWALFEFNDDRLPEDNSIPKLSSNKPRSTKAKGSIHPTDIVAFDRLPGLEVQCMARTSGLQAGQILPALTSVKIYGRTSPSHTYQLSGRASNSWKSSPPNAPRSRHSLGVPGDSGAWIIERQDGRVCGHVLAWSQRKQVAYICPMELLLRDIAETLEAYEVRLPGGEVVVTMPGYEETTGVIEISDVESWDETLGDEEEIPQLEADSYRTPADMTSKRISGISRQSSSGRMSGISRQASGKRLSGISHEASGKRASRMSSTKRSKQLDAEGLQALAVEMDKMHLQDAATSAGIGNR